MMQKIFIVGWKVSLSIKWGNLGKNYTQAVTVMTKLHLILKCGLQTTCNGLQASIRNLQRHLVQTAEKDARCSDAGLHSFTTCQPITFAHWCMLAYVEMFERDYSRLADAYKRMNSCPLGSGNFAGTAYAVDREQLAA